METNAYDTPPRAVPLTDPRVRGAFGTVRRCITGYGALSTLALAAVAAVAVAGQPVNTFMWVRAVLLPLAAVPVHRMAGAAARGSGRAFDRVRVLAVVLPIAIVGVDLVPGVCPPWYAAVQAVCMLPVTVAAYTVRRPVLRAAFPQQR